MSNTPNANLHTLIGKQPKPPIPPKPPITPKPPQQKKKTRGKKKKKTKVVVKKFRPQQLIPQPILVRARLNNPVHPQLNPLRPQFNPIRPQFNPIHPQFNPLQAQLNAVRALNLLPAPVPGMAPGQFRMPLQMPGNHPTLFQGPHQQPDMIDLTDDIAPQSPMSGNWIPMGQQNHPGPSQTPNEQLTASVLQDHWLNFQKTMQSIGHPIPKPTIPPIPINQIRAKKKLLLRLKEQDRIQKVIEEVQASKQNQSEKQKKVQNTVEANNKGNGAQASKVIQGTASQIKVQMGKSSDKKPIIMSTREEPVKNAPTTAPTQQQTSPESNVNTHASTGGPNSRRYKPFPTYDNAAYYPKGVPKSFLEKQQTYGAIQPQDGKETPRHNNAPSEPATIFEELFVTTPSTPGEPQQYSPSDMYNETLDDPEGSPSSGKRLSAFQRLGPQSQPKKPKLTINLLCSGNNDTAVREVVDETEKEEIYVPVHLRKDINESTDEIVTKYLPRWPWKRKMQARKSVTARSSKSVMILEQEQMEELYDRDTEFLQVLVKGYPAGWRKEDVLDAILDSLKGKSFIPCFIEFTPQECKFLVIRSRSALLAIHKLGFSIHKDGVELHLTISHLHITINNLDFIPRLILRKRLSMVFDGERKLDLSEFTTKPDISHFIYFPLNRLTNQSELTTLPSTVAWDYLTDLNLSHNRITSIEGFDLPKLTPRLQHLDLSYNRLERVTALLRCRNLSLRSIKLEGNPLCFDYIDPAHYIQVLRMIFPGLSEIDGVQFQRKGELPKAKRHYGHSGGKEVAEKFLEVFFPLLDCNVEDRARIEDLYHPTALLTITYRQNMLYRPIHRNFRNLFLRARLLDEGDLDSVQGAPAIAKLISKWPLLHHDQYSLNVDVMYHTDFSTILRINGILKQTAESLAEDEHLLAFTRTVVLTTTNGVEYKIMNEMLYWEEPTKEYSNAAFQINSTRANKVSLKFDSPPDDDLKHKLMIIFMKITGAEKKHSEKCLEAKEWHLRNAIEYYVKLVKLDQVNALNYSF